MTVSVTPWAIDGNTHPAVDARVAMFAQMGGTPGTFTTSTTATDGAHGIAYATDLKVTQNGTPNMSVNVALGAAFVRSGEAASQTYSVRNDATVNLAISAADATNPRKDLIVLQVRDSNFSGADDDARLFVVQGTPAASPADPSLSSTPNALVLARVAVAAAATTVVTGNITDLRVGAGGSTWFQPRGFLVATSEAVQQVTSGATEKVFITSAAITLPAGRRVKLSTAFSAFASVAADQFRVNFRRGTTVAGALVLGALGQRFSTRGGGTYQDGPITSFIYDTPDAGSNQWVVTATRASGTGTLTLESSGNAINWILVEDIGGLVA